MRDFLLIIAVFVLGIVSGVWQMLPESFNADTWSEYALYALLFFVGIGIGSDKETLKTVKHMQGRLLLLPLIIVAGSLLFSLLALPVLDTMHPREILAVSSGMGYYSLSSVLISKMHGEALATIALLANLIREIITLLLLPFLVRYAGKLSTIASGGATSMDTTLPVVVRFSGQEFVLVSIYSGLVITFLVPLLVSFFLTMDP